LGTSTSSYSVICAEARGEADSASVYFVDATGEEMVFAQAQRKVD